MALCNPRATTLVPHRTPVLLLIALLIPTLVWAADYTGKVVGVIDGDTIEVLHNHHPERIRLSGIDCPEKGQGYGQLAKTDRLDARVLARFAKEGGMSLGFSRCF